MHPNPRKLAPIFLILALAAIAWWYFNLRPASAQVYDLSASGTIETRLIGVAAEISGKVVEVLVEEGDQVHAGQVLVRFNDELLQTQLAQAQANLTLAQSNYDLVVAGPSKEQRQASIANAQVELIAARQAFDMLYDQSDLATAQAMQFLAVAEKELDRATQALDNLQGQANQADIDAARSTVVLAKDRLEKAQKDFRPYENKAEDNVVRAMLQSKVAETQKQYDAAVTRLNNLLGTANRFDLNLAQSNLFLAQAQFSDAQRTYDTLADGPDPDRVELAQARLATAQAHLALAQGVVSPEQLAVAQAQVDAAQASLHVIETQLGRSIVTAPTDGVVLMRVIEPGEVAAPSATLLTLGRLDRLSITIYIPEDRYGQITLEQSANVSVDSFPGETFSARVTQIADQAEFTPRNVQTAEGRRTTVFAIKLTIENLEGKLKPGMPADVNFLP